jgi:peptide/nickel transport system substrate-binding protein
MTRRDVLKMSAMTAAGAVLAACTAAPSPTTAPVVEATATTAAAAPAATATTAPAAPAATATTAPAAPAATVKPPIPYPDPNKLDVGGTPVKRLPTNQIVVYKALPAYKQAPWLDKLVAAGTIPAVKDRLPKEPAVYLKTGMKDGIGVYGDLWRGFSACPTAGYNRMAGVSLGWFGIEDYTETNGALVKTGPLFRFDQDIEPMPEIAKSWEWSADGMQLTMHLIEGAKWSDGAPLNADDVMFLWEGYIVDTNVNAGKHLDAWSWNGKPASLEKVDDYTVKFTFPVAKPMDCFYLMNEGNFDLMPAHILKPLHPKWSTKDPKPSYKDFANALPPDALPMVTCGPWVITEYKTDELMIMRRNPYFWKVDEDGNQLPYFDEVQYRKGTSGVGRDLCTISGDCDHMNLENPSTFVQAMTSAQDPNAKFQIGWGPELLGYGILFNFSVDVGAANDRDKAVRALLRDVRFRQALSYATDRDGVAQSIMKGPFLRGWAGGLYPGAPDYDKTQTVYYPFDVASANALLDQMGLTKGADGVRTFAKDSLTPGQPIILQLMASQDAKETQSVAEALVNQWGAIGIKINMKVADSTTINDATTAGTWDLLTDRGGQAFALPFVSPTSLAPLTANFTWHLQGTTPRKLMDFEQGMIDIVNKYRATYDAAQRKQLMAQYEATFTKNVYRLGVFVGRYGLGLAKRVKNVPDGTPAFMYQWVEPSILLESLWTPVEQQLKQNRPETIAVYKKS